jgi:hypothetical protein
MAESGWEMSPYVYARGTPDLGIAGFLDRPRYSSGYAALHHALSFMPETHMLKPFRNRVLSVYQFMHHTLGFGRENRRKILAVRKKAEQACQEQVSFDLDWSLDMQRADTILFKGYQAGHQPSEVSGLDRLYYDRAQAYEKKSPRDTYYRPTLTVDKPLAYIIPQAYREVIRRLQWNGVQIHRLRDTISLDLEYYYIEDYQSRQAPYEGHYLHSQVEVRRDTQRQLFRPGDVVVYVDQASNRYIVETLEPQGPDSFFAWNFFDGILAQKEYFSSYVFEDTAFEYLQSHPELAEELARAKAADPELAKSARGQLNFIYERSPYYERTHRRYPVGRLLWEQGAVR